MEHEERKKRMWQMGFRNPRYRKEGEEGATGEGFGAGFAEVAKYGIPLGILLKNSLQAKKLRKDSQLNLEEPELMTGRVRGLRRPNFGLRRRDPAGSSLSEMVAGQKYGDAFQRDQEIRFETADEQSRITQENQIVDRTNQSILGKNQIRNQEKSANSNLAMRELLGSNVPFQQEAVVGLYHNIQSDSTQSRYADSIDSQIASSERNQSAAAILTNPTGFSKEEVKEAREYFMGSLKKVPEKKKGGKVKKRY